MSDEQMKPGPEMDRAVCELLGIPPRSFAYYGRASHRGEPIWRKVSTDWSAMKLVWDRLVAMGCVVVSSASSIGLSASITGLGPLEHRGYASELPESLCLAVLSAFSVARAKGGER